MAPYALIWRLAIREYCLRHQLLAYGAILPLGWVVQAPSVLQTCVFFDIRMGSCQPFVNLGGQLGR